MSTDSRPLETQYCCLHHCCAYIFSTACLVLVLEPCRLSLDSTVQYEMMLLLLL